MSKAKIFAIMGQHEKFRSGDQENIVGIDANGAKLPCVSSSIETIEYLWDHIEKKDKEQFRYRIVEFEEVTHEQG